MHTKKLKFYLYSDKVEFDRKKIKIYIITETLI